MDEPLHALFEAACRHGEDSGEPDHEVGDLQDLLLAAWGVMTEAQRAALLASEAAWAVREAGGDDPRCAHGVDPTGGDVCVDCINEEYNRDADAGPA